MKSRLVLLLCPTLVCASLLACASSKQVAPAKAAASGPQPRPVPGPPQIQRATVTLEQIRREPAAVEVLHMKPVQLVVGEGKAAWVRVPQQFAKYRTMIFASNGPVNGVADYKVTRSGYLLAACNYDYQGNSSGGWEVDRWTREQFYANGWRELVAEEMGGALIDGQNRTHAIFVRPVTAGDTGRLRCNKYSPPYLILCSNTVEQ